MTTSAFPVFPGQGWSVFKMPRFKTQVQTTASGRELRAALYQNSIYDFRLTFPLLRDDATTELRTMLGFFLSRQGSFDEFLFSDPTDCSVTTQYVGTGDGSTVIFPLTRTLITNVTEPIGAVNGVSLLAVNGASQTPGTQYTLTGVRGYSGANAIQFFTAPAAGATIYANFTYYFRVRFKDDTAQLENFMQALWTWGQVDLTGIAP